MKAKQFEVKILLNKDPKKNHTDAAIAQKASNPDANGKIGEYYQLSVLALKVMVNGVMTRPQTKPIVFNVFDNGSRSLLFQDIQEALSDAANYTKLADGSVLIQKSQLGVSGDLVVEECGFNYYMTDAEGKKIIDKATKLPRQRKTVQAFIFESEMDQGLDDMIIAAEINRARKNMVETEEQKVVE